MTIPFLDLAWQESQIRARREERFAEVIARTSFVLGPDVEVFEQQFAEYCGTAHAIAVANGTDALALIWAALDLPKGSEVVMIPTTFIASASTVLQAGLVPIFADIDPATRDFDFDRLEAVITERTKAILPVHLYGQPADMHRLQAFADRHELMVIEDACQAHGARIDGKRVGAFGRAAAFSFYPGKNLGAYGDGGAITTNDHALAEKIRKLRNHGGVKKYEHEILGYNSRLDTLQAVVLDEKLKHLDAWNALRQEVAVQYRAGLADIPQLRLPPAYSDTQSVYHLYVIELLQGDRGAFMQHLADAGVSSGIHYPSTLPQLLPFKATGNASAGFPQAEAYVSRIVSLPMYPGMTNEQVAIVIGAVQNFFHG